MRRPPRAPRSRPPPTAHGGRPAFVASAAPARDVGLRVSGAPRGPPGCGRTPGPDLSRTRPRRVPRRPRRERPPRRARPSPSTSPAPATDHPERRSPSRSRATRDVDEHLARATRAGSTVAPPVPVRSDRDVRPASTIVRRRRRRVPELGVVAGAGGSERVEDRAVGAGTPTPGPRPACSPPPPGRGAPRVGPPVAASPAPATADPNRTKTDPGFRSTSGESIVRRRAPVAPLKTR